MQLADTVLLPLALFAPSKLNPRQHFDGTYIADLRANIRKNGVLENLLVRPAWCAGTSTPSQLEAARPQGDWTPAYEIVSGECRWRAAKEIPLAELPARIKELTDPELVELNLAEQLARNQLTPLEEGAAFRRQLAYENDDGSRRHTAASLGESLGKAEAYVYRRMELLDLPPFAQKALQAGRLGATTAAYITRIPDREQRADAAKQIIKGHDGEAMTKREAQDYVRANFMRELKGAPFDEEDATLVAHLAQFAPHAPCSLCPYRTGNNKELFGDVQRGDICTRPACYVAKAQAAFDRAAAVAKEQGARVLTAAESRQVFPEHASRGITSYDSPYVALDGPPDAHLLKPAVKNAPTWRELVSALKEKRLQVEVCLAMDQAGAAVEVASRDLIIAGAEKIGEPIFRGKNGRQPATAAPDTKRIREEKAAAQKRQAAAFNRLDDLRAALRTKIDGQRDAGLWQGLEIVALERLQSEGAAFLGRWLKLPGHAAKGWHHVIRAWFKKQSEAERAVLVPLLFFADAMRWRGVDAPGLAEFTAWAKTNENLIPTAAAPAPSLSKIRKDKKRVSCKPGAAAKAVAAVTGSMKRKPGKRAKKRAPRATGGKRWPQ